MNPRARLRSSRRRYAETSRLEVSTTAGPAPSCEQRLADGEAVHVRQRHVQQHELGRERPRQRERRRPVRRLADDVEPLRLEQRAGERPEAGVVVDDQDGRRHGEIVARGAAAPHQGQPCGRASGNGARRGAQPAEARGSPLQIRHLALSLRIRVRRFDSSRGHPSRRMVERKPLEPRESTCQEGRK